MFEHIIDELVETLVKEAADARRTLQQLKNLQPNPMPRLTSAAQPVKPAPAAQPVKPAPAAQPVKPAPPAQPIKPALAAQPVKPAPAAPTQSTMPEYSAWVQQWGDLQRQQNKAQARAQTTANILQAGQTGNWGSALFGNLMTRRQQRSQDKLLTKAQAQAQELF